MHKIWLTLLITVVCLNAQTRIEHYRVGTEEITVLIEAFDLYEDKGVVAKFYKDERNYDLSYLFSVRLIDKNGPCGARGITRSAYRVTRDGITVWTQWRREGKAYLAPEGVRKLTYRFDTNGTLQTEGLLYVERAHPAYADQGMRFLTRPPRTKAEQEALRRYIRNAQKRFGGRFVTGTFERKKLEYEVFEALQKQARNLWR